jgi:hypothetical protein
VFAVAAAVATVVACGVLAKMAKEAARAYLSGIGCGTEANSRIYQQASERGAGRNLAF